MVARVVVLVVLAEEWLEGVLGLEVVKKVLAVAVLAKMQLDLNQEKCYLFLMEMKLLKMGRMRIVVVDQRQ